MRSWSSLWSLSHCHSSQQSPPPGPWWRWVQVLVQHQGKGGMRPVPKTARCCPGPCGSCCLANFHICTSASTSSLFLKPAAQCVTLSSSSEHQETIHSTRLTAEPSQPSWLHVNVDTAREMNRIGAIINFWCVFVYDAIQRYRTQQRRVDAPHLFNVPSSCMEERGEK